MCVWKFGFLNKKVWFEARDCIYSYLYMLHSGQNMLAKQGNKVAVDENEQLHLIKQSKEQFLNKRDSVYSFNEGEGEIVWRSILLVIKKSS